MNHYSLNQNRPKKTNAYDNVKFGVTFGVGLNIAVESFEIANELAYALNKGVIENYKPNCTNSYYPVILAYPMLWDDRFHGEWEPVTGSVKDIIENL